jgi:hypothetical protein
MWFAILVSVVPEAEARPGDIVMAAGDSWVGAAGRMRAFSGRVNPNPAVDPAQHSSGAGS